VDTSDFEKEIEKAMDGAITKPTPRTVIPRKDETTSLSEQWMLSEKIKYELCDRLRKEKQKLQTDHDTQWLELRHRYEERISNTIADMRAELAAEQRRLVESYQERARELDLLSKKVDGDGYGPL
jgi:hypothetical protein